MVAEQAEQEMAGWQLYGRWLVFNVIGLFVGIGLIFTLGWSLGETLSTPLGMVAGQTLSFAIAALAGGALIGLLQCIVLNERGVAYPAWAAATAGGLGLGFAVTMPFVVSTPSEGNVAVLALMSAVVGLTLAVAQWFVLPQKLPRAGWWVPAATLGFVLCLLSAFLLGGENVEAQALGVGSLAYAVLSGLAVVAMFRR
jgi:hypothetical protein